MFQPAGGSLNLTQAAAICGVNHFNWLQLVNPPQAWASQAAALGWGVKDISNYHSSGYSIVQVPGRTGQSASDYSILNNDDHSLINWSDAPLPITDPFFQIAAAQPGTYGFFAHATWSIVDQTTSDGYPYAYDEVEKKPQYYIKDSANYHNNSYLEFSDSPSFEEGLLGTGESFLFTTILVGVYPDETSQDYIGQGADFNWESSVVNASNQSYFIISKEDAANLPPAVSGSVFGITFDNSTAIADVSGTGPSMGTATLTATLTSNGLPLAGETIAFTLNDGGTMTPVGTATTDSDGVATLGGISLVGFDVGSFDGIVEAGFAGDSTDSAAESTGNLTVVPPSSNGLTLAPIPNQSVLLLPGIPEVGPQSTTLTVTASATDSNPGAIVTYGIAPGGPVGPTIGPASGIFSWTISSAQGVPGIYPVTIDAIDISIPTLSTRRRSRSMSSNRRP